MNKTILLFLLIAISTTKASEKNYFIKDRSDMNRGCPKKLLIKKTSNTIQTTFTFENGQTNHNNYNFSAPTGLIKGLIYPLGVFSYYRNYQDLDGFYFQRQNCERLGVFKECGEWINMQEYKYTSASKVTFTFTDFFYRIDSDNYPTSVAKLPLYTPCTYSL